MAATAAMVIVSAGSMVYQNQVAQKQKGENGKLQRQQDANTQALTASAPNVANDTLKAQQTAMQAGQEARRKALAAFGRSDTILTGPRGITTPADGQRKTLLGL